MENTKIRIVIADDHPIYLDGIAASLSTDERIAVVGRATNGIEVLKLLHAQKVDIVVLDLNMPEMDGLEVTRIIQEKFPTVDILVLTFSDAERYIMELVKAGIKGYILKKSKKEELLEAIHTISNGDYYFEKEVNRVIFEEHRKPKSIKLTRREKEIMSLIAAGRSTPEISDKLCISPATVNTHRRNLLSKLDLKNSMALVRYAMKMIPEVIVQQSATTNKQPISQL